jgi:hypothetical protein
MKINVLTLGPMPFPLWVAVLAEDGIPSQVAIGKTSNGALKALMVDLIEDDPAFADYPDDLDGFLEAVRESESYSVDSFDHTLTFLPADSGKKANMYVAVLAENGLPTYSGLGASGEVAVNDLISRLRDEDDIPEGVDAEDLYDELMANEDGTLGEGEAYGFNTFEVTVIFSNGLNRQ